MKKIALVIAVALASLNSAQAQSQEPANPMRFFVGMGLTHGGDKLADVQYTDGTNVSITTGDLVAFNAGIDYQVTPEFSFQGSIGYHGDNASAENGSMRFQRYPVELLAYYQVAPQWRVGGGVRYVTGAKFTSSGAAYVGNYSFKGNVGAIIEGEYLVGNHWGFKLRYVSEKVTEKISGTKLDANHVGVYGNYYF